MEEAQRVMAEQAGETHLNPLHVQAIHYATLLPLLKEAIVRGGEASGPEANTGDKRPLDPPSPSHPAIEAKRVKLENGTTEVLLPVAHLRSSFEGEVRDDPVAGKEDGKAVFAILRTLPAYQQHLHLTTVTFSRPRSSPDGLTITTPESRDIDNKLPLISVHALDYLASGFEIFPHPKRGKKQYAYFQQGCGGLLDAIVELASSQDLTLQSSLSLSYSKPNLTFHLSLSVSLRQSFFTQSSSKTIGPKRILLEFLFPSPKLPIDHPGTTVDFFYRCLHRAPRTSGGLVVEKDAPPVVEETEAAREARVRKESKGKGRAIEDEEDEGEGGVEWDDGWREDEILRPVGLKATLMPFQSRTLRWLLSREGKMARLIPPVKGDEDVTMEEAVHYVHEHETEHVEHQAEEPAPKFELHDLPLETRRDIARGPLWERVALDLIGEREGETLLYWFNRVTSALQVEDPTSGYGDEAAKEGEDDEVVIVEEKRDIFGNGLVTGGGLLSEEMGLGKTIMIISLILMHYQPDRNKLPSYYNAWIESDVQPTDITLIICPAAIVVQWEQEIAKHAPDLQVLRYKGTKTVSEDWTPAYIAQHFDVMLTTFDVLKKEVNLARKPHRHGTRSGEEKPRYRRSLLVQIDFLRVIMDEAQMLGATVSGTSETVSLIARKFSFAVTGTPLQNRIDDLQGILRFIEVEPVGSDKTYLKYLFEDVATFQRLWKAVAERTLKNDVEHELVLPSQRRFVVPVEFGKIEKYNYNIRYEEALADLGLDDDGTPMRMQVLDEDGVMNPWTLDKESSNRWLVILRQLCCHPQVGQVNKKALVGGTANTLKTVDEVLITMKEAAISGQRSDIRALWLSRVKKAQLLMYDQEECPRFEMALAIFYETLRAIEPVAEEIAEDLRQVWKESQVKKARSGSVDSSVVEDGLAGALGLGFDDDEKASENEDPMTDSERALSVKLGALRGRLRDFMTVQHSAQFFVGSCYFNMGKFPEEESAAYEKADLIRQSVLKPWETRVGKSIDRLAEQLEERELRRSLDVKDLEVEFNKSGHGLVAQGVFDDIDLTTDVLNGYAELLFEWRGSVIRMMMTRVSISGEDATGEEYAERAELQEKLDVYLEAYKALLADWRYGLTGETSALAEAQGLEAYAFKDKQEWAAAAGTHRSRTAKGSKKEGRLADRIAPTLERGDTPGDILRYELLVERITAKGEENEDAEIVPIRTLIKKLKDASERAIPEKESQLLLSEFHRLRKTLSVKDIHLERLRAEVQDIIRSFNSRLQYFGQLQVLSDEVGDPDFASGKLKSVTQEMAAREVDEAALELSIAKRRTQRRYLESLHETEATGNAFDTICPICNDTYVKGIVTSCGHLFCKSCFDRWRGQSSDCATCKRPLKRDDWQAVKYGRKAAFQANPDAPRGDLVLEDVPFDLPIRLRTIDEATIEALGEIETVQKLSSKSDLIVKHVKHIRSNDPTAKIVIFCAWTESLLVLMATFARNGIQYVRLEGKGSGKKEDVVTKFVQDPNVAVFFLHTKSQSAGLNLTVAEYVFLVEPLLFPSLEQQAVGRVHRIGQTKQTTVFQYYIEDTVDQRVAELRARQKTSLFLEETEDQSGASKSASSMRSKKAEEGIEDADDVSRCILDPQHFLALQNALLPPNLQASRVLHDPDVDMAPPIVMQENAQTVGVVEEDVQEGGTGRGEYWRE